MSLIYITGPTASGKSTICEKLDKMGYETYDTDKDGTRYWIDDTTGEATKEFKKDEAQDRLLMNKNKLGIPKSWLLKLKTQNVGKLVFICGTSPVDHSETGIFDKIFVLSIDEPTLINRIKTRTNNRYGKKPHQLESAAKWRQATIDRYKKLGAHEIDSKLPVDEIANRILEISRDK